MAVLLNAGDGSFALAAFYSVGLTANYVTARDLNHDGVLDLIVAGGNGFAVLRGLGPGTFTAPLVLPQAFAHYWVGVADFNGDGNLDLGGDGSPGQFYAGNGDGTFAAPVSTATIPYGAVVGDFNADGKMDIVYLILFTGYRWENRFRLLSHEDWINPALYVEFENINGADKTLLEVVNHDGNPDLTRPNSDTHFEKKREIEAKLILGSYYKGWTIAENFIAEKNVRHEPYEFGYAIGVSRPLAMKARAERCNFCAENLQIGAEMYGGFIVGDGQLPHPGLKIIFETYYASRVQKTLTISPDYQFIANPAYNRDRGPVNVLSLRLHLSVDEPGSSCRSRDRRPYSLVRLACSSHAA